VKAEITVHTHTHSLSLYVHIYIYIYIYTYFIFQTEKNVLPLERTTMNTVCGKNTVYSENNMEDVNALCGQMQF